MFFIHAVLRYSYKWWIPKIWQLKFIAIVDWNIVNEETAFAEKLIDKAVFDFYEYLQGSFETDYDLYNFS